MPGAPTFQFHKGAIRTQQSLQSQQSTLNFNSIKVRLERKVPTHYHIVMMNFNSIKVRLELSSQLDQINFNSFQFHKGAIRTEEAGLNPNLMMKFQFHKGAIRTTH